ncbi:MAG: hypothetical protein II865_00175 [Bacteroidales bacterium]|nr:hypothetical protein [Bacteroidales bacterium]
MIERIVIRDVATHGYEGVTFDNLQLVNFIYGGNNCDKTSLSRTLACTEPEKEYHNCKIKWNSSPAGDPRLQSSNHSPQTIRNHRIVFSCNPACRDAIHRVSIISTFHRISIISHIYRVFIVPTLHLAFCIRAPNGLAINIYDGMNMIRHDDKQWDFHMRVKDGDVHHQLIGILAYGRQLHERFFFSFNFSKIMFPSRCADGNKIDTTVIPVPFCTCGMDSISVLK